METFIGQIRSGRFLYQSARKQENKNSLLQENKSPYL